MLELDGPTLRPLLVHATLAGLTPLVPVPFVDDAVKQRIVRRLVRELAETRRLALTEGDVRILADDPSRPWLDGVATNVVLLPLKLVLKKTFVVLQGTRIVDLASECFHRGYLVDQIFEQRWCAPSGPHPPRAVRLAIDDVCREVPTKPVAHAFRTAFEQSASALGTLAEVVRNRRSGSSGSPADPPLEDDPRASPAVMDVVKRLQRAIAAAPEEHFRTLDERLAAKLGPVARLAT